MEDTNQRLNIQTVQNDISDKPHNTVRPGCPFRRQRRGWSQAASAQREVLNTFPYTLSPYLGLQLPDFLRFIRAAAQMKRLLFLSQTGETFPSKDNETSACSSAGEQLSRGKSWCSYHSPFKNLGASMPSNGNSKNVNNSLQRSER